MYIFNKENYNGKILNNFDVGQQFCVSISYTFFYWAGRTVALILISFHDFIAEISFWVLVCSKNHVNQRLDIFLYFFYCLNVVIDQYMPCLYIYVLLIGEVTRQCNTDETWNLPVYKCVRESVKQLHQQVC